MAETEVSTAVFPVAGRGTRFLPATKASPKEMLPIVDKPLIQYAVDEALAAGARRLVFITGSSKRAIEDHFDTDDALEKLLDSQGKHDLAELVRSVLPSYASCIYIRQPAPLGLGHAVPCLKQMAATFHERGASVLGVEEVPKRDTDKYGIVEVEPGDGAVSRILS